MSDKSELPAPRLQLRWEKSPPGSRYEWQCHYELVLPLGEYDIRAEQEDDDGLPLPNLKELVVPINCPTMRGSSGIPCTAAATGERYYDAPYRDGAHAQWDAKVLGNPPIFVIAPDGTAFEKSDV